MLNIKVEWFDIEKKLGQSTAMSQVFLDNEVLKDSNYYIPMDTGNARDSGIIHSKIGSGQIQWVAPYIKPIYYDSNMNFSTDRNPNATNLWYEYAKAQNLDDWVKGAEEAFKQGF
ncbi:minor capsid protein [Paraliobacillus ryukyuensis]|uniref:minor capsid protein n=1 Tax=Paraliobacillus ryukyuensis TaxID=200904 RepID=UPI0009A89658|nr:minor capsid protein [Paraliobacillus ryukyuensis]